MKKSVLILVFMLFSGSAARADEIVVQCRNASRLPNGVSVSIFSEEGRLYAKLAYRANLGPSVTAGPLPVSRSEATQSTMGAPMVFVGQAFELSINVSSAPTAEGYYGHVVADVEGRTVSEDLICSP